MAAADSTPNQFPMAPRCGTEEEFAAVRRLFETCGYRERDILQRLDIAHISMFKPLRQGRQTAAQLETSLDALIQLLLDGETLAETTLRRLLPDGALETMAALDLIARDPRDSSKWFSTVHLPPISGLLVASDRTSPPDGVEADEMPADIVFPAGFEHTRDFLAALPQGSCEALLDIGTGTGVAALLGAESYALRAWGCDITPRATYFAEFNRRLNDVEDATFVTGDLYAPVEGLTFDRIIAHPPYVPHPGTKYVYRDGGEDGEQILRRIVEGAPRYLRPGGLLCVVAMVADTEDETVEQRLRRWLGDAQGEFDVVVAAHWLRPPAQLAGKISMKGIATAEEVRFVEDLWQRRKVTFLCYGRILLRRRSEARPVVTVRALRGKSLAPHHVEWLLDWETAARNPAAHEWLMAQRLALAPQARMHLLHTVRDGRFEVSAIALQSSEPFETDCRVEAWVAQVVCECDGERSLRELFEAAKAGEVLGAETPERDFAQALATLVSGGILAPRATPEP
jgi:carbamoyltransferase